MPQICENCIGYCATDYEISISGISDGGGCPIANTLNGTYTLTQVAPFDYTGPTTQGCGYWSGGTNDITIQVNIVSVSGILEWQLMIMVKCSVNACDHWRLSYKYTTTDSDANGTDCTIPITLAIDPDNTEQVCLGSIVINYPSSLVLTPVGSSTCGNYDDCCANQSITDNNNASIVGDPHLTGFLGQKIDIIGKGGSVYNFLSDSTIQYNALLKNCQPWATHVEKVGISIDTQLGIKRILVDCVKGPLIDDAILPINKIITFDTKLKSRNGIDIKANLLWDGNNLRINSGKFIINIYKWKEWGKPILNQIFKVNKYGMLIDGVLPDGIIGKSVLPYNYHNFKEDKFLVKDLWGTDFYENKFLSGRDITPTFGVFPKKPKPILWL